MVRPHGALANLTPIEYADRCVPQLQLGGASQPQSPWDRLNRDRRSSDGSNGCWLTSCENPGEEVVILAGRSVPRKLLRILKAQLREGCCFFSVT
jgi:hypothetical protein